MVLATPKPAFFEPSARVARAHAMKNCVSIIFALSRLSEREVGGASQERWEHLRCAAYRLRQLLVEDIAEERSKPGTAEPSRLEWCDVDALVGAVAERIEARAAEAGVEASVYCGGGFMEADPAALGEALFNLVANAIEASVRGGWVALETRLLANGDQHWLVRDTGPGMPIELHDQPGRLLASTREGGSGVGMALARAAFARQGGTLRIESGSASGTAMTVMLPRRANGEPQ